MSRDPVVIVGAGGFGREVLDVLRASNSAGLSTWEFAGFVADDEPDPGVLSRIEALWLGSVSTFLAAPGATHYVIAVGSPRIRRDLASMFDGVGLDAATLIHPTASFGMDVTIGAGTVICSHTSLTTNVRIGRHVHVNLNSTIGHDVTIDDFVSINPLVAISGDVHIGEGVTFGTHSTILQGLTVGIDSTVGAGAAVVKDVPPALTVVGVPARPLT